MSCKRLKGENEGKNQGCPEGEEKNVEKIDKCVEKIDIFI